MVLTRLTSTTKSFMTEKLGLTEFEAELLILNKFYIASKQLLSKIDESIDESTSFTDLQKLIDESNLSNNDITKLIDSFSKDLFLLIESLASDFKEEKARLVSEYRDLLNNDLETFIQVH